MEKYAKIINEETKECMVGLGTNTAFYKKIGMRLAEVHEAQDEYGDIIYILDAWLEPEPEPEQPEEEQGETENAEQEQENPVVSSD